MIGEIKRSGTNVHGVIPADQPALPNGRRAILWRATVVNGPHATRTSALEAAQLFEAAPDLLAAREAVAWAIKAHSDEWLNSGGWRELGLMQEKLDAAIAKAEGRP